VARLTPADGPGTVSVGALIEQAGADERRVFLKMDIEGGEYDVVDDLIAHEDRINCIVGEFHRIGKKAAAYFAQGLSVSGKSRVTRRIIELRSRVRPGDSGGPLVLENGRVGGVVFAESKVDPSVGYALSPIDVWQRVQPAIGRTAAVATGPCLR